MFEVEHTRPRAVSLRVVVMPRAKRSPLRLPSGPTFASSGNGCTFTQIGGDKIVGSSSWPDAEGRRQERYQVLTIRDGKITDMQVCGSWRQAKRFAKRTLR